MTTCSSPAHKAEDLRLEGKERKGEALKLMIPGARDGTRADHVS
jgi:hypothetical protein